MLKGFRNLWVKAVRPGSSASCALQPPAKTRDSKWHIITNLNPNLCNLPKLYKPLTLSPHPQTSPKTKRQTTVRLARNYCSVASRARVGQSYASREPLRTSHAGCFWVVVLVFLLGLQCFGTFTPSYLRRSSYVAARRWSLLTPLGEFRVSLLKPSWVSTVVITESSFKKPCGS